MTLAALTEIPIVGILGPRCFQRLETEHKRCRPWIAFLARKDESFPTTKLSTNPASNNSISMKRLLILEDSPERVRRFRSAMAEAGNTEVLIWDSAPEMIKNLPKHLHHTSLISLDHDLIPESSSAVDPGCGIDVCAYLATLPPVCPVILHTANEEAAWAMLFKLSAAGWEADWVRHEQVGELWIGRLWAPKVKSYFR